MRFIHLGKKHSAWIAALFATVLIVVLNRLTLEGSGAVNEATRLQLVYAFGKASSIDNFPVYDPRGNNPYPLPYMIGFQDIRRENHDFPSREVGESLWYYYVPVLFKYLGLTRPYVSLALFYGLFLWAALFCGFKRALENGCGLLYSVFAGTSLWWMLKGLEVYPISVYFQQYAIAPTLLVLAFDVLDLSRRKCWSWNDRSFRLRILSVAFFSASAAFSVLARSPVILSVYSAVCVFAALPLLISPAERALQQFSFKKSVAASLLVFALFSGVKRMAGNGNIGTNKQFRSMNYVSDHVFWHALWCSLGDPGDKRYPFTWSDGAAVARAWQLNPHLKAQYSKDYEAALRGDVLDVLKKDPGFFVTHFKTRWLFDVWPYIFALLVLIAGIAFRSILNPWESALATTLLVSLLATRVAQFLTASYPFYYFQIRFVESAAYFVGLYLVLKLIIVAAYRLQRTRKATSEPRAQPN